MNHKKIIAFTLSTLGFVSLSTLAHSWPHHQQYGHGHQAYGHQHTIPSLLALSVKAITDKVIPEFMHRRQWDPKLDHLSHDLMMLVLQDLSHRHPEWILPLLIRGGEHWQEAFRNFFQDRTHYLPDENWDAYGHGHNIYGQEGHHVYGHGHHGVNVSIDDIPYNTLTPEDWTQFYGTPDTWNIAIDHTTDAPTHGSRHNYHVYGHGYNHQDPLPWNWSPVQLLAGAYHALPYLQDLREPDRPDLRLRTPAYVLHFAERYGDIGLAQLARRALQEQEAHRQHLADIQRRHQEVRALRHEDYGHHHGAATASYHRSYGHHHYDQRHHDDYYGYDHHYGHRRYGSYGHGW
jgi:hypothetical protein